MTDAISFCNNCGGQNPATASICARCGAPQNTISSSVGTLAAVTQVRYAGFWLRFVAAFLDAILVQAVVVPVAMVLSVVFAVVGSTTRQWSGGGFPMAHFGFIWLFSLLVSWIYEATMESSSRQATLGKMILGMKVTDLKGNRISFARASGRHFAKVVSGMILFIGYIMAGFTVRKQALHDIIVETLVLRVSS
jgi:uncharacterized RDD family membrane protein YckC